VPVPIPMPRLPRVSPVDGESMSQSTNTSGSESSHVNALRMVPEDIQQTSKFAREFVVGCLIPWMEKNVLDWSEAVSKPWILSFVPKASLIKFSSNRRLPSRLFSSTRRLFGTSSPVPSHTHHTSSSVASLPRSSTSSNSSSTSSPPSQQRRLAEFATIIGDYKLAVTVWESLRKELKGGSVSCSSPFQTLHVFITFIGHITSGPFIISCTSTTCPEFARCHSCRKSRAASTSAITSPHTSCQVGDRNSSAGICEQCT
jgi:hypothetical protein